MIRRTLVSIDFDAFVPEDPMWDFGHMDTPFMSETIWMHRYGMKDTIRTTGYERMFWRENANLLFRVKEPVLLSDSHCYAYDAAEEYGCTRVVTVDAHHDCWPVAEEGKVHCHDWLKIWLDSRAKNAVWYQPEWSWNLFDTDIVRREPLCRLPKLQLQLNQDDEIVLHICRSGPWVAPWLDADFNRFAMTAIREHPKRAARVMGDTDPMKPRWSEGDYSNAERMNNWIELERPSQ
jgi:hypothetical protein